MWAARNRRRSRDSMGWWFLCEAGNRRVTRFVKLSMGFSISCCGAEPGATAHPCIQRPTHFLVRLDVVGGFYCDHSERGMSDLGGNEKSFCRTSDPLKRAVR